MNAGTLRPAPIRVPAEGAQAPEMFDKGKTGVALKPVLDGQGNVTGYVEVRGDKPVARTPLYLIGIGRAQGIVKPYNEILARNPNYKPSNSLPPSHIKSAKEAAIRDNEEIEAKKRYAEQLKRDRIHEQTQEAITIEQRRHALLAQPEVQDLQQQLDDAIQQIGGTENIEELQEFCDANDIPIQLDPAEDLENLRATVRGMFQQHIEGLLRKQQGLEPDDGYTRAVELVRKEKKATIPLLKQKLGIDSDTAKRIIEQMQADGVVSEKNASGVRKVL